MTAETISETVSQSRQAPRTIARLAPFIASLVTTAVFVGIVFAKGPPALRHDWLFPMGRSAFIQRMFDLSMGWSVNGLGQPNPYPMTYFVAWPLAFVAEVCGPHAALFILVVAVALAVNYAGHAVARIIGVPPPGGAVLGAYLLFNPWTYNKVVAGHLTQTIAYAGLATLLAQVLTGRLGQRNVAIATVLTALQTQFFLIAVTLLLTVIRRPATRYALLIGLIAFSPSIIGIVLDRVDLLRWPFTVAFENDQSVPLKSGLVLQGYFPHYSDAAFAVVGPVLFVMVALALYGVIVARNRSAIVASAIVVLSVVLASGTTGLIGGLWRWAIVNVPSVGVYRELYDLIGLTAAAYAFLLACAMRRHRISILVAASVSLCFIVAWVIRPPSRFWISADSLSALPAEVTSAQRYALMPPFQPTSFKGMGSGADLAYIGRSPQNAPINSLLPVFPANVALAKYARYGDASALARLGISIIECRRNFKEALGAELFYGVRSAPCPRAPVLLSNVAPIVSVIAWAGICNICSRAGVGAIFFGDLFPASRFRAVSIPRVETDPKRGWIDVRLQFTQAPQLGEPLGGAYTEQSSTPVSVPAEKYVLASVRGSLVAADGAVVSADTQGYRWIREAHPYGKLYCRGRCAVVGTSEKLYGTAEASEAAATAIAFSRPIPAIVEATIPAGRSGILRFTENYDPGWFAVRLPFALLPHVRLDAALNGWRIAAQRTPVVVVLLQVTSLLQTIAGVFGLAAVVTALTLHRREKEGTPTCANDVAR